MCSNKLALVYIIFYHADSIQGFKFSKYQWNFELCLTFNKYLYIKVGWCETNGNDEIDLII